MSAITIQIFLPDGEPRGLRIAEITTSIVQALAFPRTHLKASFQRPEAKRVALYFLLGQKEQIAKPTVYIGETSTVQNRLNSHNTDKDFWQTAIVITSRIDSFTGAHGKYLEWLSIQMARKAGRYDLEQNDPKKPHVTESMESDLLQIFDTIKILLGTLGFPVFEPLVRDEERKDSEMFICKGPEAYATGQMVDDGFVVFKGSKGRKTGVPSALKWRWLETLRRPLIDHGIIKEDGDQYIFTADFLFSSPSAASVAVLGRTSNGWNDWKNKDGKTLNDVIRVVKGETKEVTE